MKIEKSYLYKKEEVEDQIIWDWKLELTLSTESRYTYLWQSLEHTIWFSRGYMVIDMSSVEGYDIQS